jgi:hypothetical protein
MCEKRGNLHPREHDALPTGPGRLGAVRLRLATVFPVLRRDRNRIRLPRSMIRARLAGVPLWVGDALRKTGQVAQARKHLLQSLRSGLQPRTVTLLAPASLPPAVGDLLQRNWRGLKTAARASSVRKQ